MPLIVQQWEDRVAGSTRSLEREIQGQEEGMVGNISQVERPDNGIDCHETQQSEFFVLFPRWPRNCRSRKTAKVLTFTRGYREQSYLKEAEMHLRKITNIRRDIFGENHEFTLVSLTNLALVHAARGKLEEGAELMSQVIKAQKSREEVDEHVVMGNMTSLASIYYDLGRFNEAEVLMVQVAETISIASNVKGRYLLRCEAFLTLLRAQKCRAAS